MFQDYTADNIKLLTTGTSGVAYSSSVSTFMRTNYILGIYQQSNVTGFSKQMILDSLQDNVLLTLDMHLSSFDAARKYYPFVYTYVAANPVYDIVPTTNMTLLHTESASGNYATEAKVLIPKLQLESNQNQYLIVGYLSDGEASNIEIVIDAKLHLEDYRVFQPSK